MEKAEIKPFKEEARITGAFNVYNEIALSWYNCHRHTRFVSRLKEMALRWGQGKLLNIGCGHGPDFIPFADRLELYGLDSSLKMLEILKKHMSEKGIKVQAVIGDAAVLPFQENSFDCVTAVAVYHCLKEEKDRIGAFGELNRVLKPGGEAFVTVWNRNQKQFLGKGKQVLVPWRLNQKTLYRYYYLFSQSEISALARRAGFQVTILPDELPGTGIFTERRNICLLLKKRAY